MKAFSGFTPNVLDITERKSYPKTKKIKNISRIHHVKYNYSEAFLNQLFDNGAKSGNKITLQQKKLNKQCVNNSTQLLTQLFYFSRKAAKKKKEEIVEDDDFTINADDCDVFRQMVKILKVKVKVIMMRSFLPGKQIGEEKP